MHIFEPASECGTAGIDEMQQQTVNLLSFQPLPKKVFDAQLAYAMLAQLGSEAPVNWAKRKSASNGIWRVCWNAWMACRCLRCG